ncbi:hypothetical protein LIER_29256 [Lithospermum erythrorhizon]|uniref:Uncharacterized protein n=1 Tax=Lithospermum erythrorhizon TaxID=34254 RepID=A0AAV3RIL1_LITER
MPKFKTFSGFGDPGNHLKSFDSHLSFWASDDEVYARTFPNNLFMDKFGASIVADDDEGPLMEIQQKPGKTLRSFATRFEEVATNIPTANEKEFVRRDQGSPPRHNGRTPPRRNMDNEKDHDVDPRITGMVDTISGEIAGLPRKHLKPVSTPLTRFTGHCVYPMGIAELDLTVGEVPKTTTVRASFTFVDIPHPSYNGLIGRPLLNALRAVISALHLKMKFLTTGGVGGDLRGSKEGISLLPIIYTTRHLPEDTLSRKEGEGIPYHHYEGSRYDWDNDPKERESEKHGDPMKIWKDIPGVDVELALQRLHADPSFQPVKQKKRNFLDEKNLAIQKEIEDLAKANAIRELQFPEWITNAVMVKKSNNKWRMCTDFTNLNKTYPKDYYPLPCLGRLVDGSARHEVFDFLDASRGDHKILLPEDDQEKNGFHNGVWSLVLESDAVRIEKCRGHLSKDGKSCVQRADWENIKIYVDDMLVKSRNARTIWEI